MADISAIKINGTEYGIGTDIKKIKVNEAEYAIGTELTKIKANGIEYDLVNGSGGHTTIVSWADGTDEQIAAMVAAADAGILNLSDYWHEGDKRTVQLSAIDAMVNNYAYMKPQPAQTVTLVLINENEKHPYVTPPESGRIYPYFLVQQEDCLSETGGIPTEISGWWNKYLEAFPSGLKNIFHEIYFPYGYKSGNGRRNAKVNILGSYEIYGPIQISGRQNYNERDVTAQLEYFKNNKEHRIKKLGNGNATNWWTGTRSDQQGWYIYITDTGYHGSYSGASGKYAGICPCMAI